MKNLNITFSDADFQRLKKAKMIESANISWEKFILRCCAKRVSVKKEMRK